MRSLVVQVTRDAIAGADFGQVLEWLESAGLTLVNPFSHAITCVEVDNSEVAITTESKITKSLRSDLPGNVNMWFDESSNAFLSWTAWEMRIYLDGKNVEEKRKVLCAVVGGFAEICDGPGAGWKICVADEELIEGDDM